MNENLAVSATLTPLATQLSAGASRILLMDYCGAITPRQLDAPTLETAALVRGAATHDLGWMRRVEVRGEDRLRWLSGMVTNTVKDIPENGGAWNLVLNSQGRIQGDLTVWREGDALALTIAADQYEKLMAHLDRFIIMDDVELVPHDVTAETAVGLTGPKASEVLGRMGLPVPPESMNGLRCEWKGFELVVRRTFGALAQRFEIWTPVPGLMLLWRALSTAGASPIGAASFEAFRVTEGVPAYGTDIVERDLPQETSQTRALHFNKGCYLGQEIVERIRSRGNVHRHLRQLELDGPLPPAGTEVRLDSTAIGHITSAVELPLESGIRRFALAMIRTDAEAKNQPLSYGNKEGTATILAQPPVL